MKKEEIKIEITQAEREAMVEAYIQCGIPSDDQERLEDDMRAGYMTINDGRDGKTYAYYYDGNDESAVEVGNPSHVLSPDEIEENFE